MRTAGYIDCQGAKRLVGTNAIACGQIGIPARNRLSSTFDAQGITTQHGRKTSPVIKQRLQMIETLFTIAASHESGLGSTPISTGQGSIKASGQANHDLAPPCVGKEARKPR